MEFVILGVIIVIGIGLGVYGKKKRKWEPFLNFVLRMVSGTIGIYLANLIFQGIGLKFIVGVNTYNLLTLGLLGTPGFLLLYGVSAYFTLSA